MDTAKIQLGVLVIGILAVLLIVTLILGGSTVQLSR
jgi:hypothetical protein